MAKDNRGKKVALKQENTSKAPRKRKKKLTPVKLTIRILLAVFLVMLLVFLFVVGRYVYSYFKTDDNSGTVAPIDHETTAEGELSKVSYYLVGVMGKTSADPLSAISLVCFDKKAGTLDVLQMPVSTYLGKTDGWDVTTLDAVWSDPQPLPWCDKCRKRVYAPEVAEGNTHSVCGEKLTTKKGSASENLIDIFNDQYSMPVDAFFIMPQAALMRMVDAVGGVTVESDIAFTAGDTKYKKGTQTLTGEAALQYALTEGYSSTPETDLTRMLRQRQVFAALLNRMLSLSEKDLLDKVIDPVMSSSTPIRVSETLLSRKAMMAGLSRASADNADNEDAMCALIGGIGKLEKENMQYHLLPGGSTKNGSKKVYTVQKEALKTLLTEHFNPYGQPIGDADLAVSELTTSAKPDTKTASFASAAPAQEAALTEESSGTNE